MTNEKELTHIDLFSGIGGFTLAAEWAGLKTVVFCEKEEFCQKVLQKRFGAIADSKSMGRRNGATKNKGKKSRKINSFSNQAPLLIPEIRDFDGAKYRGATLLTGGFPCQPFSVAGQRRGKEDDRYLWPEMLRVISEAKPYWILAENVPGIFHMALDTVLADLEGKGYTTGTFIIPACGLNAPHRRNRVWIVANSGCQYGEGTENKGKPERPIFEEKNASEPERSIKDGGLRDASNSRKQERNWLPNIRRKKMAEIGNENQNAPNPKSRMPRKQTKQERGEDIGRGNKDVADSDSRRNRRYESEGIKERSTARSSNGQINRHSNIINVQGFRKQSNSKESFRLYNRKESGWQEDWYEVATRFCRVDDGVPDRVHRLKALGNAIVPQIAYEILKNIAWIENNSVA